MISFLVTVLFFLAFTGATLLGTYCLAYNPGRRKIQIYATLCYVFAFLMLLFAVLSINPYTSLLFLWSKVGPFYTMDILGKVAVLIFILLILFYYYAKKQDFLRIPDDVLLSKGYALKNRKRVNYIYYSKYICIVASFANLLNLYSMREHFWSTLLYSTILVYVTVALILSSFSKISIRAKEWILTLAFTALTSATIILYSNMSVSNVLWIFAVVIMQMCILSDEKINLAIIGTFSLFSLYYVWLHSAGRIINIDADLILGGAFAYLFSLLVTVLINRLFLQHIRANDEQYKFQQMLSKMSSDFLEVGSGNLNHEIFMALEAIGRYFSFLSAKVSYTSTSSTLPYKNCFWTDVSPGTIEENKVLELQAFVDGFIESHLMDKKSENTNRIIDSKCMMLINRQLVEPAQNNMGIYQIFDDLPKDLLYVLAFPIAIDNKLRGSVTFLFAADSKVKTKLREKKRRLGESISDIQRFENCKTLVNSFANAIGRVIAMDEMQKLVFIDRLTELPNRKSFATTVQAAIAETEATGQFFAIAFLDINEFKRVNEALGHQLADNVLKEAASRLKKGLYGWGTAASFEGDEFLILSKPLNSHEDFESKIREFLKLFSARITVDNVEFNLSASCGIAYYPDDGPTVEYLIRNAEHAMLEAKRVGRNNYMVCTENMKEEYFTKSSLANNLYKALENSNIFLFFHPWVDVNSGEIPACKVLARWKHPLDGRLLSTDLISGADKSGLTLLIGDWILKNTCIQSRAFAEAGMPPILMRIEIPEIQFYAKDFPEKVKKALKDGHMHPKLLELAISEATVMHDPKEALERMATLKELGVRLALSDFGADRFTLSILRDLSMDTVNVSPVFTKEISENTKDKAIIEVTMILANAIGAAVSAEGIDSPNQLSSLKELGINYCCGNLFYPPLSEEQFKGVF